MKTIITLLLVALTAAQFAGALTLDDAIERGLEANAQVKIAQYGRDSAREDAKIALTNFLPRAKAEGSYTRLGEVPVIQMPPMFGGMTIEMGKQDNYRLNVGVQQPIFTGGKIVQGYRAARFSALMQEQNLLSEKTSTVVNIAQAYYGVVKAELFLENMQQARERMDGHLAVIEGMFAQGMVSRNDLLQTRVASSEIDLLIIRANNAVNATRLGLNFLLNFPSDTMLALEPDTSSANVAWPALSDGIEYGLSWRPDIRMLELGVSATRAVEAISWGAFAPDVVGMFNWTYQRPNQALEEEFYDSWNVTIAASWSLISFGERIFSVRKARFNRRQTAETLDMATRAAEMQIRNQFNALDEAEKALEVSRRRLEQANEAYRVAVAEFETGLVTNTNILDANSTLIQAQAEYISAIADLKIAAIEYEAAIGAVVTE
ncbi:MAG TPA: TolC family protein [candidate division Zixibacteria bacterium]|nr:TolC family protein [candidate division Zixibacteria bacterium]